MAKILCVLYDDPISGHPTSYPRDDLPKIERYPDGQTLPTPRSIDFTPGELLGSVSGELGLRKFLEAGGHEFVVTSDKDGDMAEKQVLQQRAAALLDRVDSMDPQVLARLHGTLRSPRPGPAEPPTLTEAGEIFLASSRQVLTQPQRSGMRRQDRNSPPYAATLIK